MAKKKNSGREYNLNVFHAYLRTGIQTLRGWRRILNGYDKIDVWKWDEIIRDGVKAEGTYFHSAETKEQRIFFIDNILEQYDFVISEWEKEIRPKIDEELIDEKYTDKNLFMIPAGRRLLEMMQSIYNRQQYWTKRKEDILNKEQKNAEQLPVQELGLAAATGDTFKEVFEKAVQNKIIEIDPKRNFKFLYAIEKGFHDAEFSNWLRSKFTVTEKTYAQYCTYNNFKNYLKEYYSQQDAKKEKRKKEIEQEKKEVGLIPENKKLNEVSYKWDASIFSEVNKLFKKAKGKLIDGSTKSKDFKDIFSSKSLSNITPVRWHNDNASELLYFISVLTEAKKIPKERFNYKKLRGCFLKNNGEQFTQNLKSLKSQLHLNSKSMKREIDTIVSSL